MRISLAGLAALSVVCLAACSDGASGVGPREDAGGLRDAGDAPGTLDGGGADAAVEPVTDAALGHDAGIDAGPSSEADSGVDAGADPALDAGADAALGDAGADAALDDAGTDAALDDAGADAAGPDTGVFGPDASEHAGGDGGADAGEGSHEVTPALVAGAQHTCLLKADGTVRCWGADVLGQSTPPAGVRFAKLAAAGTSTCGITDAGAVRCWGHTPASPVSSSGPFLDLDLAQFGGCALAANGAVDCWGDYDGYEGDAGSGATDLYVSRGNDYGWCAVTSQGRGFCRGGYWQSAPEPAWRAGKIVQIEYPCALYDDGTVDCLDPGPPPFAGVPVVRLVHEGRAAHNQYVCAVRQDGSASCRYGDHDFPSGELVDLALGQSHTCGLREDGGVGCTSNFEQLDALRAAAPSELGFTRVVVGDDGACAVRGDGTLACFAGAAALDTPDDAFTQVDVGLAGACGLSAAGKLTCWGTDNWLAPLPSAMETASFSAISVGDGFVCGVVAAGFSQGRILCGGRHAFGQGAPSFIPPDGHEYTQVSVGGNRLFCMTDETDTLRCIQTPNAEYSAEPVGLQVDTFAAGWEYVCAKTKAGAFSCSSSNQAARLGMPANTDFVEFATGREGVCGRYADGTVACWGVAGSLRHAPTIALSSVGVGYSFACGLDTQGKVHCWGHEDAGQSDVPADL